MPPSPKEISQQSPPSGSLPTVALAGGHTLPVYVYGFSTTFRLRDLVPIVGPGEVEATKDCLLVLLEGSLPGRPKLLALLDFGTVVFVGVDIATRDAFMDKLTRRLEPEPHPPLTEEFLVEVVGGARSEVKFDRVILSDPSLPTLKIVCLLLAQSVAMDYYDEDVQDIQRRSDTITAKLRSKGRLPGRVGDMVKFIGRCMETKNDIIATLSLFDKPESTWEDAGLDRLYRALREELEIDDRFRALEAKLRMIQENLVLLVDLCNSRSTWRLELIVVLLILLEVILTVWQLVNGRGHV